MFLWSASVCPLNIHVTYNTNLDPNHAVFIISSVGASAVGVGALQFLLGNLPLFLCIFPSQIFTSHL